MNVPPWLKLTFALLLGSAIFFSCTLSKKSVKRPQQRAIRGSILYYSLIAQNHYNNQEYEKAIYNYEKILTDFDEQKNINLEEFAWTYYEIGYNYYKMGNYTEAIKNFQIVLDEYDVLAASILSRRIIAKIREEQPAS